MLYDKKSVYIDKKLRLLLAIIYNYNNGKMYFEKGNYNNILFQMAKTDRSNWIIDMVEELNNLSNVERKQNSSALIIIIIIINCALELNDLSYYAWICLCMQIRTIQS